MARIAITGANRGIGLEFVRQFVERGDEVIALCRKPSPKLQDLEKSHTNRLEIHEGFDITREDALHRFVTALGERDIQTLVNNAGVMERTSIDDLNLEAIRRQFEVNTLGPLRLTHTLLGRLSQGAKVALVTSRMGSIADNTSGGSYGYRMSKAALNMAGTSLAHDLRDKGVAVAILHPGYVKTDMTGNAGNLEAKDAAAGLIARIDGLSLATSGTFWHSDGTVLPW